PILDGATSGLYDDVSLGKTGGAYVSLARALMNPDGADAVAWAAQKEESQKDIKTGAIVAGVGAAVGIIGNVAINHDAMKGSSGSKGSSRTRKKYQRVTEKVEEIQKEADTAPVEQPCSDITGTTGEGYVPNCKCAEEGYEFSTDKGCYKEAEQAAPVCDKTGLVNSESCTCIANSIETNKVCSCDVANGYKEVEGSCVKEEKPRTVVARLSLSSDTTFKLGSSTLSDKAKTILSELKQAIMEDKALFTEGKYEIVITGHTDRVPFKRGSSMTNQLLSERRALSVKTELLNGMSGILDSSKIKTSGVADTQCDKATYPKNNDERCRKVVITIIAEDEEDVLEVSGELLEQVSSGIADGMGGKVGALDANLLNVK
ncbi:MAG: OmpA family protein, partial [Alphaproteobacteria bacterium]|nr:OmpA family protein [Alphaproteobacteria bacterium]